MIFLFLSYLGQKFGNIQCEIIDQCFLIFFDARHFFSTHTYYLTVLKRQVVKFAAPQQYFRAPKGTAAPLLRTTAMYIIQFFPNANRKNASKTINFPYLDIFWPSLANSFFAHYVKWILEK